MRAEVDVHAPARIALLVCGALVTLPFLFPEHELPMRSFYDEWFALALGCLVLIVLLARAPAGAAAVPEITLAFFALAAWLGVQPILRPPAYLQLPLSAATYLVMAGALAWAAQRIVAELGAERFCDTLAGFVLVGAILNAAIGIIQSYGVPDALEGIVARHFGVKAVGHVAQSNLYALYLALGEASLVYLVVRHRVRIAVAVGGAAVLAYAAALSQSRSAILFAVALVALAWLARGQAVDARALRRVMLAVAGAVLAAIALLPRVHAWLGIPILHPFGFDRIIDTVDPSGLFIENRLRIWPFALQIAASAPLVGVGWGEFALAAFRAGLPPTMAAEGEIWSSPHNTFLQLFAEAGLPAVAIAFIAALRWWLPVLCAVAKRATLSLWWLAAVAAVVSLHAMVEYPLWYAHFLAVAALAFGAAAPRTWRITLPRVAPGVGLALALAFAVLLAWGFRDYQRLARSHWIATGRTLAPPSEVQTAIATLRDVARGPLAPRAEPWLYRSLPIDANDLDAKIAMGWRVLAANPDSRFIARQAALLALAGRAAEGQRFVDHALHTLPDAPARITLILTETPHVDPALLAPLLAAARETKR